MMKINKLSAIILAGALTCTTPAMVYADTTSDAVDQAVAVLEDSGIDDLLSDPNCIKNQALMLINDEYQIGRAHV